MQERQSANGLCEGVGAGVEEDPLAPMLRQSIFWRAERQAPSAWAEHVPFAFWLVDVLRPKMIVELGTHTGVSYSAMCQAVKTLGLPASCFAVDTWKGDEHSGLYSENIYSDFAAFHDPRYGAFSHLVRSTFDDALPGFVDGSVDLLHIDGFHSYEAVRRDYESWLPKLSREAVVLFHDTNVREAGYGVLRLWSEVTGGRRHFEFLHGYGLGVVGMAPAYRGPLGFLFDANDDNRLAGWVREVFASAGQVGALQQARAECAARIATLEAELAQTYASTSWRVTGPLRAARQFLAGLRQG